jgi:hypothetical protein
MMMDQVVSFLSPNSIEVGSNGGIKQRIRGRRKWTIRLERVIVQHDGGEEVHCFSKDIIEEQGNGGAEGGRGVDGDD